MTYHAYEKGTKHSDTADDDSDEFSDEDGEHEDNELKTEQCVEVKPQWLKVSRKDKKCSGIAM